MALFHQPKDGMIRIEHLSGGAWTKISGHGCYSEADAKRYMTLCPYAFRYSMNGGEWVGPTGTAPTSEEIEEESDRLKARMDKLNIDPTNLQAIIDFFRSVKCRLEEPKQ
jgi:hypothetical protein